MRNLKAAVAVGLSGALLAASASSADARWFRHGHYGRGPGLVGGVVLGAAAVATLPFAVLGAAASPAPPPPPPAYYGPQQYGYGPPPGYYRGYAPPPSGYYQNGGPPPGYNYGPPPGYGGY